MAGNRPFVNAASAGLSVVAAQAAKPHKSRLGPLAYAVGALRAGVSAKPLRCTVIVDGEQRAGGRAWQVVVAVTGAFGGGSEIGGTRVGDGRLDVAVVPAGSRIGLVRRAYGMRAGRLTKQSDVDARARRHDRARDRGQPELQRRRRDLPLRTRPLHAARRRIRTRDPLMNYRWPTAIAVAHRRPLRGGLPAPPPRAGAGLRAARRVDRGRLRRVPARHRGAHDGADRRTATRSSCSSTATRSSPR